LTGYQLHGGVNIAATLQAEIRAARAVIGILTSNSLASPWVLCELGAVWGLVSNFVPVLAGLDPDTLTGPLGVAHAWRLDNINDVRASFVPTRTTPGKYRTPASAAPGRRRRSIKGACIVRRNVSAGHRCGAYGAYG
jgi:hypothetical protein